MALIIVQAAAKILLIEYQEMRYKQQIICTAQAYQLVLKA